MSATGGKITLRFEVDIAQLEQKIAKVQQNLDKVQTSGDKVSQSLEKTSQASVTSAVRFQTLSQGAINLTTSFAQTYTSLSNIQRAQTTVAAATVSLERAEDLLQRKQVQLNDERKKAIPNMDKIRLLTNEISTAERDLGVKRQKLSDATDQANDTNILFAVNLLNVSFAAIQTGKSMIDMAKATTVASVGVGGVTKAVGVLRAAFTTLQAHPVFAIITLGLLAWEFSFSKIIKELTGIDASFEALTKHALGLDKMKTSTEILGTEFENTGSQIESMGGTMTSVSGNMVTSIGNIGTSVTQLKNSFIDMSTGITELATAFTGIGAQPSYLDIIKRTNSEISSIMSDMNMLQKEGFGIEGARALILEDILHDYDMIRDSIIDQHVQNKITTEEMHKQLDLLDEQITLRKQALETARKQVEKEKELGRALDDNQKKTTKFGRFGIDIAKQMGIDPNSVRGMVINQTGRDIGQVANAISLDEALRISDLEDAMASSMQGLYKGPSNLATAIRNQRIAEAIGSNSNAFARKVYENNVRTYADRQIRANGYGGGRIGTNFFGTGFFKSTGATAAYQVDKVAVPAWVKEQIREQDAWRNSVEGQLSMLANALLTGGTFAFSRKVAKSLARNGGGLSIYQSNVLRTAGLLGVSVPYEGFKTTANEVFTGAAAGLSQIIKETGVREEFLFAAMNAISQTSRAAVKAIIPYGFSAVRNWAAAQGYNKMAYTMTQQGLQNYVSRVAAGNFGIYDATVLNAMTGASVAEYTSEVNDFNTKIAPLLNIAHSDFKTTLVDPKRGINEIDDRIRWTQRLEQISTGATVF